jgi:hypothetical protein
VNPNFLELDQFNKEALENLKIGVSDLDDIADKNEQANNSIKMAIESEKRSKFKTKIQKK